MYLLETSVVILNKFTVLKSLSVLLGRQVLSCGYLETAEILVCFLKERWSFSGVFSS